MKEPRNRNKLIRRLAISAAAAILAIAIFSSKDESPEVKVYTVGRGDIIESIPASGKIHPVSEVKISPDVSGEIVQINCREGDTVSKGDLLLKIRQDLYISTVERCEASLNTLKAQYLQQKARVRKTRGDYERCSVLYAGNAISRSEFENAQALYEAEVEQLNAAQYGVKSGEASLKEARENLCKTTIYAPMDGTVSRLSVEEGERVVGTSQMAGTEMLRIADMSRMEVVSDIGENDIVNISPGDSVSITVDACPNDIFSGKVTQIANSAKNIGALIEQVTNFEVRISIEQDASGHEGLKLLRPGMSASISITTEGKTDVMSIPIQCIFTEGGCAKVWVVDEDGKVWQRKIVTGIQDISRIEVRDSLSEGERVVCSPYSAITKGLSDGMKVKVTQ